MGFTDSIVLFESFNEPLDAFTNNVPTLSAQTKIKLDSDQFYQFTRIFAQVCYPATTLGAAFPSFFERQPYRAPGDASAGQRHLLACISRRFSSPYWLIDLHTQRCIRDRKPVLILALSHCTEGKSSCHGRRHWQSDS